MRTRDLFRSERELLPQAPPPPPPILGTGDLILVADDDTAALRRLSEHLREMGYQVAQAHTGREALNCIETRKPVLVISDIVMPQMDGFELHRILKRRAETRAIPFVFLAAHGEVPEWQLGGEALITKPVQLDQLKSIIKRALSKEQPAEKPVQKPAEEAPVVEAVPPASPPEQTEPVVPPGRDVEERPDRMDQGARTVWDQEIRDRRRRARMAQPEEWESTEQEEEAAPAGRAGAEARFVPKAQVLWDEPQAGGTDAAAKSGEGRQYEAPSRAAEVAHEAPAAQPVAPTSPPGPPLVSPLAHWGPVETPRPASREPVAETEPTERPQPLASPLADWSPARLPQPSVREPMAPVTRAERPREREMDREMDRGLCDRPMAEVPRARRPEPFPSPATRDVKPPLQDRPSAAEAPRESFGLGRRAAQRMEPTRPVRQAREMMPPEPTWDKTTATSALSGKSPVQEKGTRVRPEAGRTQAEPVRPLDVEGTAARLRRSRPDRPAGMADRAAQPEPLGTPEEQELFDRAQRFVSYTLEAVRRGVELDLTGCDRLAGLMVDSVNGSDYLLRKALSRGNGFDISVHSVNVAVFAVKIGNGLGYSREQLVQTCMAALLHDIGMSRIPDEILLRHGSLSASEAAQIKQHPEYGREALSPLGPEFDWLVHATYQVHERENGQGYPQGLKGNQIVEQAKIIGVADIYEALSHPRTFRKTFVPHEALQKLITMRGEFFDAKVIRALMSEISMFPLGTYVQLNTNEIGQVVATNRNNVLKPVVEVLYDHAGARLRQPKAINLEQFPMIVIMKPVTEEELPK